MSLPLHHTFFFTSHTRSRGKRHHHHHHPLQLTQTIHTLSLSPTEGMCPPPTSHKGWGDSHVTHICHLLSFTTSLMRQKEPPKKIIQYVFCVKNIYCLLSCEKCQSHFTQFMVQTKIRSQSNTKRRSLGTKKNLLAFRCKI